MLATSHVLTCSTGPARYGFMRSVRDARRAALHGESHPELAHRVGGALSDAAAAVVTRLRRFTALPIAVGFGISTDEHVNQIWRHADAAVVGSRIVAEIEAAGSSPDLVIRIGELTRFLVRGR